MARFSSGWIKLHRDVLDSDISDNLILYGIWTQLLLMAVYKPTKILWNGKQRELAPGSVVFGIRACSEKWKISKSVIQKWLHYLHKTERIVFESCSRGSLVTICNWALYQVSEEAPCSPSVHDEFTAYSPRVHGEVTACSPSTHGEALSKEGKKEEERTKKKEGKNSNPGIRAEYPPEFDEVWVLYGRKGDKRAAYGEFKNLNLQQGDIENLTKAIGNCHRRQTDPKYRKDFERYLKTDWREDLTPTSTSNHVHPKTQERLDVYNRFLEREDLRSAEAAKEVSNET